MKVSELVLTDEHDTISPDTSLVEATKKLLSLPRGVLIILGKDKTPKGVLADAQILRAVSEGKDCHKETCASHMNTDIMAVGLDTDVSEIVAEMNARKPHAVVAVDDDGGFAGYFSPNDYREALSS
ncbi:MAG TPA: CBS domain-containing protein [Candidatus Poseidoniaceae archaeon]|nr:CBS domain-containing protein [Candidatus Poseidoniaceae archaeon]